MFSPLGEVAADEDDDDGILMNAVKWRKGGTDACVRSIYT